MPLAELLFSDPKDRTHGALEAALGRLAAWRARLDPRKDPLGTEDLAAAHRDLAALADEVQRLRWHDAMARTFALPDPTFAVTFASPGLRISSRNPTFRPPAQFAPSWELAAAGGEAESVQLAVVALWNKLDAVAVEVSPFFPVGGAGSPPDLSASLALVDEVEVRPGPSLTPDQTGWMPDPLRPFQPFGVEPGGVRSLLLTVEVPPDLPPGDYDGQVTVQPRGHEPVRLAVRLRRLGFALQGQPLAVVGHLDERALSALGSTGETPVPPKGKRPVPLPVRHALYDLLLRHRVCPVPLLGGTEAADLEEALYCVEQGAALVVLREASSAALAPNEAEVARAAHAAEKLLDAGGRRCGALLLPLAPNDEKTRSRMSALGRSLAREHPALFLLAGGDGEPPGDLMAHAWRRPLGADPPRRPHDSDVDVRLSRTARREGWELVAASPESPVPSLLVTSPLHHVRLLPWLAWQHGIRALFLRGVTRWRDDDDLRDGVLVYPPVGGASAPRAPAGEASPPRAGDGAPAHSVPCGSLRLVALRDGVEDYACLRHLWDRARLLRARGGERHAALLASAERLLAEAAAGIGTLQRPCRDAQVLAALHTQVCREAERLEAAWWAEVDAAKDLPPPPPEVAAKPGDAQVALTWARSPDAKAAGYNVYRARDPRGPFVRLNPLPIEGLTWVDRAVADGVTYHYLVRSCRDELVDGPRSAVASAVTRPAPRVVWLPLVEPRPGAPGPLHVALRLEGPGTGGLLPLVRPQLAYTVGSAALGGFENMARQEDGTWALDLPDPGWGRLAGKAIRLQARIVDRQGRVVAQPVERLVPIGP